MKKNILILVLMYSFFSFSQEGLQPKIDALKQQIAKTSHLQKLKLLDSLSELTLYNSDYNYDSIVKATITQAIALDSFNLAGKHTSDRVYYLAIRANKPEKSLEVFNDFVEKQFKGIEDAVYTKLYLHSAYGFYYSGDTQASIDHYKKSEAYAIKAKDSVILGKARVYMSDSYADLGQFAKAGEVLEEAEAVFERTKDTFNLMLAINSRANIYSRLGFKVEAKPVRDELIELALQRNDYRMLQSAYFNKSIDSKAKSGELRIYNLKEALKYAKLSGNISYEPKILISLLEAYSMIKDLKEANNTLNIIKSHPLFVEEEWLGILDYVDALADFNLASGNYKEAIRLGEQSLLLDKNKEFATAIHSHKLLAKAYENDKNLKKSNENYLALVLYKDSLNLERNIKALTYYQTLYETKKRDATIEKQESEIALLDAENRIKSLWILFGGIGLLVIFLLIYLIRNKRFVESKQKMQEVFSQDLINEQEKERMRLARELHDGIGQKLMLLSKRTKNLGDDSTESLASTTLEEIRNISKGLHPSNLGRLGLTEAIKALLYDINANTDLFFTEVIENVDSLLSKESELHLYRIIQESLNNIVKHSAAKAVEFNIQKSIETVEVFIRDNGNGFDIEDKQKGKSLGMKTLFERAKIINTQMNIQSDLGKGTVITLSIPY